MDQTLLPRSIDRLGAFRPLDRLDGPLTAAARALTKSDARSRLLHGAAFGHRLHPMLTDVPIGSWTSAAVLDLVGGRRARPAAQRLVALGVVAAVPTMLAGLADWDGTSGDERRMGAAHALANSVALVCEWRSWRARRRGRHLRGVLWSGAAMGVATAAGAIGGHLAYDKGVGVDRDVPVARDGAWHRVASLAQLPLHAPEAGTAGDDAPVAIVRTGDGPCAMASVCSHAGGPLAEGSVEHDGLVCPWHGSRFALRDGSVQRGPAVTPQPVYETRVTSDGAVEVRVPGADGRSGADAVAARAAGS